MFPQLLFGVPDASPDGTVRTVAGSMAYFMLASTAVYIVSSMDPQWKLNARLLQGEADGWLLYLVKGYLLLMFLPVVAAWKFCTNFWPHTRITTWLHPRKSGPLMSFGRLLATVGRGTSIVLVIGMTGLLAAALAVGSSTVECANHGEPQSIGGRGRCPGCTDSSWGGAERLTAA